MIPAETVILSPSAAPEIISIAFPLKVMEINGDVMAKPASDSEAISLSPACGIFTSSCLVSVGVSTDTSMISPLDVPFSAAALLSRASTTAVEIPASATPEEPEADTSVEIVVVSLIFSVVTVIAGGV